MTIDAKLLTVESSSATSTRNQLTELSGKERSERRQLIQAAREISSSGVLGDVEIAFAVDKISQRPVMRVVDRKTNEVLRQIPSEQALRLAEQLKNREEGHFF